jgi:hypothetical protein
MPECVGCALIDNHSRDFAGIAKALAMACANPAFISSVGPLLRCRTITKGLDGPATNTQVEKAILRSGLSGRQDTRQWSSSSKRVQRYFLDVTTMFLSLPKMSENTSRKINLRSESKRGTVRFSPAIPPETRRRPHQQYPSAEDWQRCTSGMMDRRTTTTYFFGRRWQLFEPQYVSIASLVS